VETVGAYEAKTNLPKLLERVSKGERIIITKHGVPVAVLHPPEFQRKTEPKKIISALRDFRNQHRLNGLCLREMIEEGRR
jgi:prevent-host-death family protein